MPGWVVFPEGMDPDHPGGFVRRMLGDYAQDVPDDPLAKQRRVGQALAGVGATPAGSTADKRQAPVSAGGFFGGVKSALDQAGQQWQRLGAATGVLSEQAARAAGAYDPSPQSPASPGMAYRVGEFLGGWARPLDLAVGGAVGGAVHGLTGRAGTAVADRVLDATGSTLAGKAARYATEGALTGAAMGGPAHAANTRVFEGRWPGIGELGQATAMGAAVGAVADPAMRGGADLVARTARGTKAAIWDTDPTPSPTTANMLVPMEKVTSMGRRFWDAAKGEFLPEKPPEMPFWHSRVARTLEGVKQERMPAEQWRSFLDSRKGQYAQEERQLSGIDQWLTEQGGRTLTKGEVLDAYAERQPGLTETQYGHDPSVPPPDLETARWDRLTKWEADNAQDKRDYEELQKKYAKEGPRESGAARRLRRDITSRKGAFEAARIVRQAWADAPDAPSLIANIRAEYDRHMQMFTRIGDDLRAIEDRLDLAKPGSEESKSLEYEQEKKRLYYEGMRSAVRVLENEIERVDDLSSSGPPAKFQGQHQNRGGTDYTEITQQAPAFDGGQHQTVKYGHQWKDPNTVVWQRGKTREEFAGDRRAYDVEEVQSDLHQEGQQSGYRTPGEEPPVPDEWRAQRGSDGSFTIHNEADGTFLAGGQTLHEALDKAMVDERHWQDNGYGSLSEESFNALDRHFNKQPDLPFKKGAWQGLAARRALMEGTARDADVVSWTPGEVQADRWNARHLVRDFRYHDNGDGTFRVNAAHDRGVIHEPAMKAQQVAAMFGRGILKQMEAGEGAPPPHRPDSPMKVIDPQDLKVGGEALMRQYDHDLPKALQGELRGLGQQNTDVTPIQYPELDHARPSVPLDAATKARIRSDGLRMASGLPVNWETIKGAGKRFVRGFKGEAPDTRPEEQVSEELFSSWRALDGGDSDALETFKAAAKTMAERSAAQAKKYPATRMRLTQETIEQIAMGEHEAIAEQLVAKAVGKTADEKLKWVDDQLERIDNAMAMLGAGWVRDVGRAPEGTPWWTRPEGEGWEEGLGHWWRKRQTEAGKTVTKVLDEAHDTARKDIYGTDKYGFEMLGDRELEKLSPSALSSLRLASGLPVDVRATVDLWHKGVRSFKKWRAAMAEKGHEYPSDAKARAVFKEGGALLAKIYDDPVLNIQKLRLDPTGRAALAHMAEKHRAMKGELTESVALRRAMMHDMADALGLDHKALRPEAAQKLEGWQIAAREELINRRVDAAEDAYKQLEDPALPDAKKKELTEFIDRVEGQVDGLLSDVVAGASQKGRDLQSLKLAARNSTDINTWRRRVKKAKADAPYTLADEQELGARLAKVREAKTPQEKQLAETNLASFVAEQKTDPKVLQAVGLFKALITPPGAVDVANTGSNLVMQGLQRVDQASAAVYDQMLTLVAGGARTTAMPFGRGAGRAMRRGAKEALAAARTEWTTGIDPSTQGKFAPTRNQVTLFGARDNAANTITSKYLNFHWRRFGAADAAFREMQFWHSLNSEARVIGINEGLSGKALGDRVEHVIQHLDEYPELTMQAFEDAEYVTFVKDNLATQAIETGRSKLQPGGKAAVGTAVPFVRTLMNVADATVDYTPAVGLLRESIAAAFDSGWTRKRFVSLLGQQTTGSMLVATAYALANKGLITGAAPTSQAEREHWEAEGKQAYAIKIGGTWRNFERIAGPAGPLMGLGADLATFAREKDQYEPGKTTADKAKTAARGFVGSTVESAPGGSLTVFGKHQTSDPEGDFASNLGANVAAPNLGNMAGVARGLDPVERRTDGVGDVIKSRIPGLRETLPARTTATGDSVRRTGGLLGALLDPTNPRKATDTPVLREMERLQVWFSRPSKIDSYSPAQQATRRRMGLTQNKLPEKYERSEAARIELARAAGPRVQERLAKLIARPFYQKLPDEQKRKLLQQVLNAEKQRADTRQAAQSLRAKAVPTPFPEE